MLLNLTVESALCVRFTFHGHVSDFKFYNSFVVIIEGNNKQNYRTDTFLTPTKLKAEFLTEMTCIIHSAVPSKVTSSTKLPTQS